jgi:D-glycerate 3-kinase
MLGFRPVETRELPDPHFYLINEYLDQYGVWHELVDAFVWLEPDDPRFMLEWRVEAEERSKASGLAGMSESDVVAFVSKFLPAYLTYLPGLRERPLAISRFLHFVIGRDRLPL